MLNDHVGLYVKYSTNRLSPWGFSFADAHQAEVARLAGEHADCFVALVCGQDGIACLNTAELGRVLDADHRTSEWVKATRRPNEKYTITGSDGRRGFKVADNEYPSKIWATLSTT